MSHWLRWAVALLILGGLVWQAVRLGEPLRDALRPEHASAVVWSLLPGMLAFLAFARSWIALSRADSAWARAGSLWFASLLARYAPGAVWQGAIRVAGANRAGQSAWHALAQYGSEQALACASAASLALLLAAVGPPLAPSLMLSLATVAALGIAAPSLLARFVVPARWNLRALAWMIVGHLMLAAGFAILATAWPSVPAAQSAGFAQAFLVAGLAGVLAVFVPAGLGVREGVLAWLLGPFVGTAEALSIALAARVWSIACELLAWSVWAGIAARSATR